MRIAMPRGDIRYIRFYINDPDGEHTSIDFAEIYFTVKKTTKDVNFIFQKKLSTGDITKLGDGDYQIKIEPQDTNSLVYGQYKFDVQVEYQFETESELTIKESFVGDFVITDEVTFYQNE